MNFYWLLGRRYCAICGTAMSKANGTWVCRNPGHAETARRKQAAKGMAGRPPSGKPVPVKYCPACGLRMNRVKSLTGYTWKCPSPWHVIKVRHKKQAIARKARRARTEKKK